MYDIIFHNVLLIFSSVALKFFKENKSLHSNHAKVLKIEKYKTENLPKNKCFTIRIEWVNKLIFGDLKVEEFT